MPPATGVLPASRGVGMGRQAYQARMGPTMAENRQPDTRLYDDVVFICGGMRESVVKALTSAVGQLETFPALSRMSAAGVRADEIGGKADIVRRHPAGSGCGGTGGALRCAAGEGPLWIRAFTPRQTYADF